LIHWFFEVSNVTDVSELSGFIWLVPLNIFLVGLFQTFNYWCTRQKQFEKISFSRIGQSFITAGVQLLSKFSALGSGGLVYGLVAGQFAGSAIMTTGITCNKMKQVVRKTVLTRASLVACAYRYRHFPLYFCLGTFVNIASWQVAPVLLSFYFGATVSGEYFLVYRMASIPMSFLGAAIGQVILQRSATRLAHNEQIADMVENVVGKLIAFGMLPFLGLALIAPTAFAVIFGKEWGISGIYLQIMMPLFFLQFLAAPVSMVLIALQKQRVLAVLQLFMLAGALSSLHIGGRLIGNPTGCLMVYTLVQSTVYFCYLVIICRFSHASPRMIMRAALFITTKRKAAI
jgi:O-antigen/teichoic acid export membrane protein